MINPFKWIGYKVAERIWDWAYNSSPVHKWWLFQSANWLIDCYPYDIHISGSKEYPLKDKCWIALFLMLGIVNAITGIGKLVEIYNGKINVSAIGFVLSAFTLMLISFGIATFIVNYEIIRNKENVQ